MTCEGGDLCAFTNFGYTITAGLVLICRVVVKDCTHDAHDFAHLLTCVDSSVVGIG
jgi:hypothetical protein